MLALGALFFAAALTVKPDEAVLRTGCEASDEAVTTLARGTELQLRFAMSGSGGPCYKVSAQQQGREVQGWLPASAVDGVEAFDKGRANAPLIRTTTTTSTPGGTAPRINAPADHPLAKASALIEARQPAAALELAEKSMRITGRDYPSLVIAGIAAWQSDDIRRALEYLRESQTLKQEPSIAALIARLEREHAGDRSSERLYGYRFLLRYEDGNLPPETARAIVATLEQEFTRIASELGCRTDERLVTVIQSRAAYNASTDAAEWSGGLYDGTKIRIPVAPSAAITPELRRIFAHELVHACLAQMGNFPIWLHEGVAQKLAGETPSQPRLSALRAALRSNRMPRLENMNQTWSRMSAQHASLAYAYAWQAAELLIERYRAYGIQNVLRNPDRLPAITDELNKLLQGES